MDKKIAPIYLWNHAILYFLNLKESFYHKLTIPELELIQKTHFFDHLDEASLKELYSSISIVRYLAGDLILREGDIGDAFYIISFGSVRVFTEEEEGKKIALARLEKGDFFGEQALLEESNRTRNASIEAITDVTLIKINEFFITKILQMDEPLKARLKKLGYQQVIQNLTAFADTYQSIKNELLSESREIQFYHPNEIIFSLGEQPEYVYFILSGCVELNFSLYQEMPTSKILLHRGHLFGEVAVIQKTSRIATATAKTPVSLVTMKSDEFSRIYHEKPQIKSLVDALYRNYQLPKFGAIQQYLGKILDVDTITTIYHLKNERTVIATRAIGQDYFTMTLIEENEETQNFIYEKIGVRKTELSLKNNFLTEIKNYGLWDNLPKACQFLLNHEALTEKQLHYFQMTGDFSLPQDEDLNDREKLVCECMSVSRGTLLDLIESGVTTFKELSDTTGCSTVCGCCKYTVLEMLGQSVWLSAKLSKLTTHNSQIMSFCVTPLESYFNPYQPGQHLIIQAKIGENWVERPYSISGQGKMGELYITVKKESQGIFSPWLFENADQELLVKTTQPQGEFVTNFNDPRPLIYFAGGIGITPFLAYVKKLVDSNHTKPMHLVYCAVKSEDFILLEELKQFSQQNPHFSFELRPTEVLGMLAPEDIIKYSQKSKDLDIYICGPEGFEKFIQETLLKHGFAPQNIHIERFTFAGSQ